MLLPIEFVRLLVKQATWPERRRAPQSECMPKSMCFSSRHGGSCIFTNPCLNFCHLNRSPRVMRSLPKRCLPSPSSARLLLRQSRLRTTKYRPFGVTEYPLLSFRDVIGGPSAGRRARRTRKSVTTGWLSFLGLKRPNCVASNCSMTLSKPPFRWPRDNGYDDRAATVLG